MMVAAFRQDLTDGDRMAVPSEISAILAAIIVPAKIHRKHWRARRSLLLPWPGPPVPTSFLDKNGRTLGTGIAFAPMDMRSSGADCRYSDRDRWGSGRRRLPSPGTEIRNNYRRALPELQLLTHNCASASAIMPQGTSYSVALFPQTATISPAAGLPMTPGFPDVPVAAGAGPAPSVFAASQLCVPMGNRP